MAVYRKKLLDKDGNTIIPAVGDIYGTVYNATLSSATAGGRADYEFAPDTPIENNKVYAVQFPDPTVNNATIILGDGVVSGSILVPPVAATDSPNYELLTTDMINNTEPLLLMYSGVQWVCLNQKKKVATADLEDKAVKSAKIDWTTMSYVSNVGSSVIDVTQTVTTLCEVTIPKTGVYFVSATVDPNLLGTDPSNANVFLALNSGNPITGAQVYFNNPSKAWFMGGCQVSAIVSCEEGDKIQFRGQSGGANKWQAGDRRRLDAFRIG